MISFSKHHCVLTPPRQTRQFLHLFIGWYQTSTWYAIAFSINIHFLHNLKRADEAKMSCIDDVVELYFVVCQERGKKRLVITVYQ